ncbi:MAG: BMC domain-containing protein [Spirochaetales bacterium]|jgi:microcompartment protein CcmL/EutN|nr:BMC domain-containing protein [Spirochaetales bacterium]
MYVDVIGVQEYSSIAVGFLALDAIVKAAPVNILATRIVTPGKFIVLFTGDVASVEASLTAGKDSREEDLLDELFIPNLDRKVIPAIAGPVSVQEWDALGIIESLSVTAGIVAADLAAKEAEVRIPEIRLAGGMGGKSTIKVMGRLEDVEASLAAGAGYVQGKGLLCRQVLIPRPHPDIWGHLLKAEREVDEIWK